MYNFITFLDLLKKMISIFRFFIDRN
jgi:hypothetical protein